MANSPQARKRARQAEVSRQRNAGQRSRLRTYIKRARAAILAGDVDAARETTRTAQTEIDRACGHGLLHRNTAARYKSRLNRAVQKLATAS